MRNKKRIKVTGMIALLLFSFIITAEVRAETNRDAESKAQFAFAPGGGEASEPTPIVDPEAPEYTIEPDADDNGSNGVTGNTGDLRIDYVSNFSFGSQPVSVRGQVFHAALISADAEHTDDGRIEVPAFVQVTDLRGTARGWTLSVRQDDYFTVASGEHSGTKMTGARMILSNIKTNTLQGEEAATAVSEEIVFDHVGEYYNLMTAFRGQGTGIHVAHFGEYNQGSKASAPGSVTLEIPAAVRKIVAPYQTSFTWLLANVPHTDEDDRDIGEKIDDGDEGDIVDIDGHDWIILSKDEEAATAELLRKEIAATMSYWSENPLPRDWQWQTSQVRSWLRTQFAATLSDEFLDLIIEVPKQTKLPAYSASSPEYTEADETIYLLSTDEYSAYLVCYPDFHKASNYWWLRSPGQTYDENNDDGRRGTAYSVEGDDRGRVWNSFTDADYGVRPAVTVRYK